jgi:predicted transcriptional regulator
MLIENALIEYEDGTQKYRTTEKGLQLLKIYNQIEELIPNTINSSIHKESF